MATNPREAKQAADTTATGRPMFRAADAWNSVKVFTGALIDGENPIGEQVTLWLADHCVKLVEVAVAQSTSNAGGCISIGLFYRAVSQ